MEHYNMLKGKVNKARAKCEKIVNFTKKSN